MNCQLPCHLSTHSFTIPDDRKVTVLDRQKEPSCPLPEQRQLVCRALDVPTGSPRLSHTARGKRHALIITSDHTRPLPSRITLPLLVKEMKRYNHGLHVDVLVATGLHRAPTQEECLEKFGLEMMNECTFYVHDAAEEEGLVTIDTLPSGGCLRVNRRLIETELLVAEGFIEPHFFAGFSGGAKSVLPGCAGSGSIRWNHSYAMISHPECRAGILDNPIRRDMEFAAEASGLSFILNVALNRNKEIIGAFAGHPIQAHREGCRAVSQMVAVSREMGDVVITSAGGYPFDQNLYQLVKAISTASHCVRPGGTIIALAGCSDGIGGKHFASHLKQAFFPGKMLDQFAGRDGEATENDQWQSQILLDIMQYCRVAVVTENISRQELEAMHLMHFQDVSGAVQEMERRYNLPEYIVIPDGISTLVID